MFYALGVRSREVAVRCAEHCLELVEWFLQMNRLSNIFGEGNRPTRWTVRISLLSRTPVPANRFTKSVGEQ